ncbi:hypothetical protein [Caproicibacter fermentans]|uniref:Uncharacterized protein n=1 Tax=Caproicibacter fermentans TaxID=2576756 RepID=A0A7G8T815_9FIRM|nr:hypothetical protein [Caproicibacter fermentans]QNK39756.1 hypothetical protein HCR03_13630 [Caproicibacter fermentans]
MKEGCYELWSAAELVAMKFYQKGCHTFVLTCTTNLLMKGPLNRQPMIDLSRAVRFLRKHASGFHIQPG